MTRLDRYMILGYLLALVIVYFALASITWGQAPPRDSQWYAQATTAETDLAAVETKWQPVRNADGTFWTYAPEADYQAAAVRVEAKGTNPGEGRWSSGSGTLVATTGQFTLCITNHHVVEIVRTNRVVPQITIHLRDGRSLTAHHLGDDAEEDVAAYWIADKNLPTIPIAAAEPQLGELVEVMGFGGPRPSDHAFRPFVAPLIQPTLGHYALDAPTISGDSGSGIVWRGTLIGVNFGGPVPTHYAGVKDGEPWGLVYPAHSRASTGFLRRWLTQICTPHGCQPRIVQPDQRSPGPSGSGSRNDFPGPEQFYRPDTVGPQSLFADPASPPATSPPPRTRAPQAFDYAGIADALAADGRLIDTLAADDRFRGADGRHGMNGTSPVVDYAAIHASVASDDTLLSTIAAAAAAAEPDRGMLHWLVQLAQQLGLATAIPGGAGAIAAYQFLKLFLQHRRQSPPPPPSPAPSYHSGPAGPPDDPFDDPSRR